jgi:hypothetical protein
VYFHQGIDLLGSLGDVVAMRAGVVIVANGTRGNEAVVVEVQVPGGTELDVYIHLLREPWQVGEPIQAGDVVGVVSDVAFLPPLRHVHVSRLRGPWSGSHGFNGGVGGTGQLDPLALFADPVDHDPQLLPAAPHDANEDGSVFHVAPDGDPATRLPYAFGAVELLLEATDRLTSSLYFDQGLRTVAYWIESRSGGDGVADGRQPYRLMRFDDAWRSSDANCDRLTPIMLVNLPAFRVRCGCANNRFPTLATYRLTRTSGYSGLASEVSAAQAWHTDARIGSGAPNGTGALEAREIHEARFPDGLHRVHALTGDARGEIESVFDVVVDNFRPYVERFRVLTASGVELHSAGWTFDADAGVLSFDVRPGAGVPAPRPDDRLELEVEFSEPMAAASLWIEPELGSL